MTIYVIIKQVDSLFVCIFPLQKLYPHNLGLHKLQFCTLKSDLGISGVLEYLPRVVD